MFKFSNINILHWINQVYPPGRTQLTNPEEFEPAVRITQRALPPSMVMLAYQTRQVIGAVTDTLVTMVGPGVESARAWWVQGLDLSLLGAAPAVDWSAFLTLSKVGTVGQAITLAQASFQGNILVVRLGIRSGGTAVLLTHPGGQGGGAFLVPPGYEIKGSSTAAPAAGGSLVLTAQFTEILIGEEIPSVG